MLLLFSYLQKHLYKFSIFESETEGTLEIGPVVLLSCFVGIIFQELSNLVETVLYRASYSLKKGEIRNPFLLCFIPSVDRVLMTSEEINQFKAPIRFLLRKRLKRDLDDLEIQTLKEVFAKNINVEAVQYNEALYNFCKEEALRKNKGNKMNNEQAHASMARSFAMYSFFLFILTIVTLICKIDSIDIDFSVCIIVVSGILALLFRRRSKRFAEMRYVSVFRACLYG